MKRLPQVQTGGGALLFDKRTLFRPIDRAFLFFHLTAFLLKYATWKVTLGAFHLLKTDFTKSRTV